MCQDENGLWHLVGVTSWGDGCGVFQQPGVYARVAYLLGFVVDTITRMGGVGSGNGK